VENFRTLLLKGRGPKEQSGTAHASGDSIKVAGGSLGGVMGLRLEKEDTALRRQLSGSPLLKEDWSMSIAL